MLFNNADGEPGDVVIPAMTMGEHYTIAISTGSESPAVSRFIRQEIEKNYPSLDAMIVLQHRLRDDPQGQKDHAGRAPQGTLGGAPRQDGLVHFSRFTGRGRGNG